MIELKDFQEDAVKVIANEVSLALEDTNHSRRSQSIVLKSPTGSGKTYMLSQIIARSLTGSLTLVLSPGKGDLHVQTFEALTQNLATDENIKVKEMSMEVFNTQPDAGTVMVGNWERLTTRNKATDEYSVHLTREGDRQNLFDYIAKCGEELSVTVAIDEAHYGASTDAKRIKSFLEDIDEKLISAGGLPAVVIEASATPITDGRGIRKIHTVSEEEVIDAGLMRVSGVLNADLPDEELRKENEKSQETEDFRTIEYYLLEAADEKRKALNELYKKAGSNYNALLAVQIPNSNLGAAAQQRTVEFYASRGMTVENGRVVIFTSSVKEGDIKNISNADSKIDVLIYKQAIATGWNCPRAQILVGFRHIKSKVFTIQNIGRFRRTTEGEHYPHGEFTALNKFYVYSNIESGFGIYAYEEGKGSEGDKGQRLERTLEADVDMLKKMNDYKFPVTSYSRVNQNPVNGSIVMNAAEDVIFKDSSAYKNLTFSSSTGISLFQGEYSAEDLGNLEAMAKADAKGSSVSTDLKLSDFEQSQEFSKKVMDVVTRVGDFGNNAKVADGIVGAIIPLFRFNIWKPENGKVSRAQVIDSFLSSIDNQEALLSMVEDILKEDSIQERLVAIQSDDNSSVPATQYKFNPMKAHVFPENINVIEDSDRQVRSAFYGKTLFYKQGVESGDKLSWWQESSSKPEIVFQDSLVKFLNSNQNFELVSIHKNAPWLDGDNLSLGLRIRVDDNSDPKKKRISNFFPDFVVVLRNKSNGAEFPVIIEVKDENSQKSNGLDMHLQHKVRAAFDYYENTGIPFFVVASGDSSCSIIGTDDKPREKQHRGVDLFSLLSSMLEEGTVIAESREKDDAWMIDLGL